MQQELKLNLIKWVVSLGAIAVAFVIASKFNVNSVDQEVTEESLSVNNHGTPITPLTLQKPQFNVKSHIFSITAETEDTLFLFDEVANANSEELSQKIIGLNYEYNTKSPILLIIDSPGGSVFAGTKVISAIEASKRPVYTICYGLCASMAAMIHQYGTQRYMVDRSVLMFHNASGGVQGEVNQMLSQLNMINSYTQKMDSYVAKRSGIDFNEFLSMCNSQIWIDAEDSFNKHLSDKTVSVNLSKLLKEEKFKGFVNYTKNKHTGIKLMNGVKNE